MRLVYSSYQKIIQSSPGPKKASNRKKCWDTVAGNLVTDMGSAFTFELAIFMRKLLTT